MFLCNKGHSVRAYLDTIEMTLGSIYWLESLKMNKNEKAFSPIDYEMNVKISWVKSQQFKLFQILQAPSEIEIPAK